MKKNTNIDNNSDISSLNNNDLTSDKKISKTIPEDQQVPTKEKEIEKLNSSILELQKINRSAIRSAVYWIGACHINNLINVYYTFTSFYINTFLICTTLAIFVITFLKVLKTIHLIIWMCVVIPCMIYIPSLSDISQILTTPVAIYIMYPIAKKIYESAESLGKHKQLLQSIEQ